MKWYECKNESDLKALGNFNSVKKIIAEDLEGKIKVTAKSWPSLYEKITLLQNVFRKPNTDDIWFDGFVSETEKYLFCLTKLDGKNRQKNLGVSGLHYKSKELANKWNRKISQRIHPDKCKDPRVKEAMQTLESMFLEMTK